MDVLRNWLGLSRHEIESLSQSKVLIEAVDPEEI